MTIEPDAQITAALGRRAGEGAGGAQVADAVEATWQQVETALTPIVGPMGVAALYKRSLHLAARSHAALAGVHDGSPSAVDLAALRSALTGQNAATAAAAGGALLQSFHDLFAGLVGDSLAQRLLGFLRQPS